MEVATLTATLEAAVAGFMANMAAADRQIDTTRQKMRELERQSLATQVAVASVGLSPGQAAETEASARTITRALSGVRDVAAEADIAARRLGLNDTAIAGFTTLERQVKSVDDTLVKTAVTSKDVRPGTAALGEWSTEAAVTARVRDNVTEAAVASKRVAMSPEAVAEARRLGSAYDDIRNTLLEVKEIQGATGVSAVDIAKTDLQAAKVATIRDRWLGAAAAAKGVGPSDVEIAKMALEAAQAERLRDALLEARIAGGGGGSSGFLSSRFVRGGDSAGGAGGFMSGLLSLFGGGRDGGGAIGAAEAAASGGGGGGTGFAGQGLLGGVLPGGRRASAGAITTALGLGVATTPALVPAAAGLAMGATAGLEALVGGAATLKLAFADLSKAAFTTQKGFDALTPIQQRFVTALRSIDVGFLKPLEAIAQSSVLPGLTRALHQALTPQAVSVAQGAVGAFGGGISRGAQQFGSLLGSNQFLNALGPVLQADARYLGDFLTGISRLVDAFVHLQQAAIPLTNWMDKGALHFANWVDASVKAAQSSGKLASFFDEARKALEALGGLVASIAGALHSLVQAFGGFNFAIEVIHTLSQAFAVIGQFLNANRTTFRAFFAGALGAAQDLLRVVSEMVKVFSPLIGLLNSLVTATIGWKHAIEAFLGVWLLVNLAVKTSPLFAWATVAVVLFDTLVPKTHAWRVAVEGVTAAWVVLTVAMQVNPIVAALTAVALLAAFVLTHWKQLTQALPILWRAAWDAIKGITNLAIYGLLAGFQLLLKGLKATLGWIPGIGGQIKDSLDQAIGFIQQFSVRGQNDLANAGDLAGQAWGVAFSSQISAALAANGAAIDAQSAAIQANISAAATLPAGPGMSPPEQPLSKAARAAQVGAGYSLTLPASITYDLKKAAAGHLSTAQANAEAYAYYEKILAQPGLTKPQKAAIYSAESQYAPSSAFGTPTPLQGAGTAGTVLTPRIQQAVAAAEASGIPKNEIAQYTRAINYLNDPEDDC